MEKRIVYYKFPDPIYAGKWSKDIGWVITKVQKRIHKMMVGDEWVVTKDEDVPTSYTVAVKEPGAVEITKQEYDSLNTNGESELIKDRRERKEKRMRLFDEEVIIKDRKKNK